MKHDDVECGYSSVRAQKNAANLSSLERDRLAVMALTWYDSPWSDKNRDLFEGIQEIIKRPPE